jgi:muconate cycloisomerase
MYITEIQWTSVRVPCKANQVNGTEWGVDAWELMPRFILQVHTSEGITGIGETYRGTSEENVRSIATMLKGKEPLRLCLQDLPNGEDISAYLVGWNSTKYPARRHELNRPRTPAYVGFEIALFDIVGKALNIPVHRLLGTAYREQVPVSYWFGRQSPEECHRQASLAQKLGFNDIKMKSTIEDPSAAQVIAMTDAIEPPFTIIVDANERFYRPAEAIRVAKVLEGLPITIIFEDPMPKWNLDWYRLLREQTSIPLALHLMNGQVLIEAVKKEACDYVNLQGGLIDFTKWAAIADAAGLLCWHGSGVDLGILEASYLHAAAVARNCVLPADIFGLLVREDDLLVEPLQIQQGFATVPQKPGLGVELDTDALARYQVSHGRL